MMPIQNKYNEEGSDSPRKQMCPGEKRKLTIQPDWAYGSRAMGPIPANAVLSTSHLYAVLIGGFPVRSRTALTPIRVVFESELVSIEGVSKDEL